MSFAPLVPTQPLILLIEFTRLWQYIADWERVFRRFDRDHSGTIEKRELSEALQSFGYRLSPSLLNLLLHKYGILPGLFSSDLGWLILRRCSLWHQYLVWSTSRDHF